MRPRPVVVAVGEDSAGQALDWAAAEASARSCDLRVVHVERQRWAVDPSGLVPVADFWSDRPAAEALLRTAVDRARWVAPDVAVSSSLLTGATVPQLVRQGRDAQLLVMGSARTPVPPGRRHLLVRPLVEVVAPRVPCPVAVVRPLRSGPLDGARPRVVVGPGASCPAAFDVAFSAARQRGLPVAVVGGVLDEVLATWVARFPDVPVEVCWGAADPAGAMVRESAGAALVVVGCPPRGRLRAGLGAVGRAVTQAVGCPVVVVHPGTAAEARPAEPGRRNAVPRRRAPWE